MIIMDDYTDMYFLKHKSKALDYFIEFQKKFENRLETKSKSIVLELIMVESSLMKIFVKSLNELKWIRY